MKTKTPTPTEFRTQHGDPSGWSTADMETFEHLAEVNALPADFQARMFQASEQVYARITDPTQPPTDVAAALFQAQHDAS